MMKRCTSSSVGSGLSTVATSVGSNDMPEGGRERVREQRYSR